jgi:hypothetical protein
MHTIRIEPGTGALCFVDLDVTLPWSLRRSRLPASVEALIVGSRPAVDGWLTLELGAVRLGGHVVLLSLEFHDGLLKGTHFELATAAVSTHEADPARAECAVLRDALEAGLGTTLAESGWTEFPWGRVVCALHPKDGQPWASLRHASV